MYEFRRLSAADLPLICTWLARSHVREWWPDPATQLREIEEHLAGDNVEPFAILLDGQPIGYLQCYDVAKDQCWPAQPAGARGVDQFIGEAELTGRGHGSALIRMFADRLLAQDVPRVVTDPDPANARAVRCYEKAGFRRVGPMTTPWGVTLMMARDRDAPPT